MQSVEKMVYNGLITFDANWWYYVNSRSYELYFNVEPEASKELLESFGHKYEGNPDLFVNAEIALEIITDGQEYTNLEDYDSFPRIGCRTSDGYDGEDVEWFNIYLEPQDKKALFALVKKTAAQLKGLLGYVPVHDETSATNA